MLALETVSADREVEALACSPAAVARLWDVCQVPDYRKISGQNHAELVATLYKFILGPEECIPEDWFATHDIHVHVPAGATPKDGPSAGVTMVTALMSLISRHAVREDVAMTGEVTLTGQVLPIGGLKEKALAAQRAGIGTVIAPALNEPDAEELPAHLRDDVQFRFVDHVGEVLAIALDGKPD